MNRRTGVDLDGTLSPFGLKPGEYRGVNEPVIKQLSGREVVIISNQGGVPFHYKKYPNYGDFPSETDICDRIESATQALKLANSLVTGIYVCTYSPKIELHWCGIAKENILTALGGRFPGMQIYVSDLPDDRKPNAGMLERARIYEYWGDSDEDEAAALAMNIPFLRVVRFAGV